MPSVISKEKEAYKLWLTSYQNMPKLERFGFGQKIDNLFLEILGSSFSASYFPPEQKIIALEKIISRLDVLKFMIQLAWENRLIANEKYIELSKMTEEIGRMFGGWKKGLQTKTPAK